MTWRDRIGHATLPLPVVEVQDEGITYLDRLHAPPVALHEYTVNQLAQQKGEVFERALVAARNRDWLFGAYDKGAAAGSDEGQWMDGLRSEGMAVYASLGAVLMQFFQKYRLDIYADWGNPRRQGDYKYNLNELRMLQEAALPHPLLALAVGRLALTSISTVVKRRADMYPKTIPHMETPGLVFERIYSGLRQEGSEGVVPFFGAYESLHDRVGELMVSWFGSQSTEVNNLVGTALFLRTPVSDAVFRAERQKALRMIGDNQLAQARAHLQGLYKRWPQAFNPIAQDYLFPEGTPQAITRDDKAFYATREITPRMAEYYYKKFIHPNILNQALLRAGTAMIDKVYGVIVPNTHDYDLFHVRSVSESGEQLICNAYDIAGASALPVLLPRLIRVNNRKQLQEVKSTTVMALVFRDAGRIVELATIPSGERVEDHADDLIVALRDALQRE